ncbi:MAG: hypothetical protein MZU95_03655 [Desulfomicrobium escambiense]|nr:hypothetical protein [Desulfomicrobium escambiense]
MERLGELPKTRVSHLDLRNSGGRAQMVIKRLEKAGYTRFMNWGANSRYFDIYGSQLLNRSERCEIKAFVTGGIGFVGNVSRKTSVIGRENLVAILTQ